jgi:hypothetical protein
MYEIGIEIEESDPKDHWAKIDSELAGLSDGALNELQYALLCLVPECLEAFRDNGRSLRDVVELARRNVVQEEDFRRGKGRRIEWRYRLAVRALLSHWTASRHKGDTDIAKANPLTRWLAKHLKALDPDRLRHDNVALRKAATALAAELSTPSEDAAKPSGPATKGRALRGSRSSTRTAAQHRK